MKYILLTFMLLSCFTAISQPIKGNIFLNGKFQIEKEGEYSISSLQPSLGYFINSKFATGITTGITQEYPYQGSKRIGIIWGIFTRNYFPIGSEQKFFFYLHSYLQKTKFKYPNNITDNYLVIGVFPSFAFFPTEKISIDLTFIDMYYALAVDNNSIQGRNVNAFSLKGDFIYPSLSIGFFLGKRD